MKYYNKDRQRKFNDYLLDIIVENLIEEKQILRIKHLINSSKYKEEYLEVYKDNAEYLNCLYLTDSQEEKGINYLKKKYLTKNNKIRKNCYISKCFQLNLMYSKFVEFRFAGFVELTNGFINYFEPLYNITFKSKDNKFYEFDYFHFAGFDFENNNQLKKANINWRIK